MAVRWKSAPGEPVVESREERETQEQIQLWSWVQSMQGMVPALTMFAANPNGGVRPKKYRKDKKTGKLVRYSPEGQRLKAMGVQAGFPDIQLLVPIQPYHGLFIELKAPGGDTRDNQLEWQARLRSWRYKAEIIEGWVRAAREIVIYLEPMLTDRERKNLHAAIPMS